MRTACGLSGEFRLRFADRRRGVLWDVAAGNGVTVQGRDYLLSAGFKGGPQSTAWRLGVVGGAGFAGVAAADTHASHPGWVEYVGVGGGARAAWPAGSPAGGALGSASDATITIASAGVIRGVFLADQAAVGSTAAGSILYSTAVVDADLAVTAGGVLFVTYHVRGTPQG